MLRTISFWGLPTLAAIITLVAGAAQAQQMVITANGLVASQTTVPQPSTKPAQTPCATYEVSVDLGDGLVGCTTLGAQPGSWAANNPNRTFDPNGSGPFDKMGPKAATATGSNARGDTLTYGQRGSIDKSGVVTPPPAIVQPQEGFSFVSVNPPQSCGLLGLGCAGLSPAPLTGGNGPSIIVPQVPEVPVVTPPVVHTDPGEGTTPVQTTVPVTAPGPGPAV